MNRRGSILFLFLLLVPGCHRAASSDAEINTVDMQSKPDADPTPCLCPGGLSLPGKISDWDEVAPGNCNITAQMDISNIGIDRVPDQLISRKPNKKYFNNIYATISLRNDRGYNPSWDEYYNRKKYISYGWWVLSKDDRFSSLGMDVYDVPEYKNTTNVNLILIDENNPGIIRCTGPIRGDSMLSNPTCHGNHLAKSRKYVYAVVVPTRALDAYPKIQRSVSELISVIERRCDDNNLTGTK